MSERLPPTFTSLYRLFLRAAAASVLHNRSATRKLRKLWRPTFEGAAQVLHGLQTQPLVDNERKELRRWYSLWELRMDNTLSLLSVSAQSRGIPHRLVRNINLLTKAHHRFIKLKHRANHERKWWNPQLSPKSERYKPMSVIQGSRADNREERKDKWNKLDDGAWGALGEVILMAEGRDGIHLGRIGDS